MKYAIAGLLTILAAPVAAQPLPYRQAEAQTVADAHPDLWQGSDNKRALTVMICTTLNRLDSGMWGLLSKDDRNPPYTPEDIIVWKPTQEHVDVVSDSGTVPWVVHPPIPPAWSWKPCGASEPPPNPGTPTPIPGSLEELKRLPLIQQLLAEIRQQQLVDTTAIRSDIAAFRFEADGRWEQAGKFLVKYVAPIIGSIEITRRLMKPEGQ